MSVPFAVVCPVSFETNPNTNAYKVNVFYAFHFFKKELRFHPFPCFCFSLMFNLCELSFFYAVKS
jgi:hypothetical protein